MRKINKQFKDDIEEFRQDPNYHRYGYCLKLTEEIIKFMEDHDISEEELLEKLNWSEDEWNDFLRFDSNDGSDVNLTKIAEVSIALGVEWEFNAKEQEEIEYFDPEVIT